MTLHVKKEARGRGTAGFTLIELLVVVAIIALLISILLPSLSKARAQARTTLCLSRIAQMGKAMLLYGDDYSGVFPFVVNGHNWGYLDDCPDPFENWLIDVDCATSDPDSSEWQAAHTRMRSIALAHERDWIPEYPVPRNGSLFPYARFDGVYRCPEFERVKDGIKAHSVFNYTRAIWGRRWKLSIELAREGDEPSEWGDVRGPIMKTDMVHSPANLPLILDEQWDRHVATAGAFGNSEGPWNCNDSIFHAHNIIGVYHGTPVGNRWYNGDVIAPGYVPHVWKRGGVCCYDGHAELMRDPWPTFEMSASGDLQGNLRSSPRQFRLKSKQAIRRATEHYAVTAFMSGLIFWQRGFDPEQRFGGGSIKPWGSDR